MNTRSLVLDDSMISLVVDFDPVAAYTPRMLPTADRFVLISGGVPSLPVALSNLLREDGYAMLREDGATFLREDA